MKIGVIGYGRFGKFFSKSFRKIGKVYIFRKNTQLGALKNCDWVMLSVPISEMPAVTKKISPFLKKGALVFDACSVKIWPCEIMKKNIPRHVSIIGTHPLFGPDSARETLKNHTVAVAPIRTSAKHLRHLMKFLKSLGLRVVKTTPQNHDKTIAKTQALVHFLSRAFPKITTEKLSTSTYRAFAKILQSIQHDTLELFFDMQTKNPYAKYARKEFLSKATALENKISSYPK